MFQMLGLLRFLHLILVSAANEEIFVVEMKVFGIIFNAKGWSKVPSVYYLSLSVTVRVHSYIRR